LDETNYPTEFLVLEITESLLLEDTATTTQQLHKLKEMGIKLSIDDFGTGHSSLSYLKRFPVDTIKIDKSFIQDMVKIPEDASLVQAIIAMSHSLGLNTIAEGVEDQEQLALIRELKCDFVQGYYFSKPLQPHKLAAFLSREYFTESIIPTNQPLPDNSRLQH
jgi:EAL domain-containing protein (putative c-di-GMP-specific phosphodiesterase class I)